MKLLRYLFIAPVFLYQKLISPLLPPSCIYSPTCSSYTITALKHHGIIKGTILGAARIIRCTDLFFKGGDDPVPEEFSITYVKESYRKFRKKDSR